MTIPFVFNSTDYLNLEADRLEGSPMRIALDTGPEIGIVARNVPGSSLHDGISVYGYPDLDQRQPLTPRIDSDDLLEALRSEKSLEGLVSVFFRLGLHQEVQPPSDFSIARKARVGEIVVVDLMRDWDAIFSDFRPRLRSQLRNGGDGIIIERSDDIREFHSIYTENMARVGAEEDYFFTLEYMARLFSVPGIELFMAQDDTGPLAGALIVSHGDLLFYHLGATGDRGANRSALKFVLAEVIRHHANRRFSRLILGGGLGGQNDSLLRFKRGFSKETETVFALKVILDAERYTALSGSSFEEEASDCFFPAYRAPAQ